MIWHLCTIYAQIVQRPVTTVVAQISTSNHNDLVHNYDTIDCLFIKFIASYTSCKCSLHSKDGTIGWRIPARSVLGAHARVGLGVRVRVGVSDTMNLGGAEGEASLTMRYIVYCSIPLHLSCTSPPPGCSLFELLVFIFGGRCVWVQEWVSARRHSKSVGRVLDGGLDGTRIGDRRVLEGERHLDGWLLEGAASGCHWWASGSQDTGKKA
jgi:hypothetical protein